MGIILFSLVFSVYSGIQNKFTNRTLAQFSPKLGTFDIPSATPMPTYPPEPTNPYVPVTNIYVTVKPGSQVGLITGGPVSSGAPYYCIDDEDPDGCDDNTAFWVPKGSGGAAGSCGTVIEQGHKIVNSLPHFLKGKRDSLSPAVSNCGYTTGTYSSGYISTYMPIDAYNLAGLREMSKNNSQNVLASQLLNWWNIQSTTGYIFIPYSPAAIQNHASGARPLTGCVMFLNLSGGVHVGLVNSLELVAPQSAGNGIISILQSGVSFYVDRFVVDAWNIKNTPLHQTPLQSVAGFGCHT